ncbi:MAG: glycerophosphodiester phosphodiesterase [Actinobacteria bacterium]|nr:glycerophosphodiester phosphodiesterase [Actinomycetota bacterium]
MRGRVGVMAEVKSAWANRRHDLARRTAALLSPGDAILSFERRALLEASASRPGLRTMQHVGLGTSIRVAARYAWAVGFADRRLTSRGLATARRLGLATAVYTVNDPERIRELADLGVDAVITDRPALMRGVLAERTSEARRRVGLAGEAGGGNRTRITSLEG